MDFKRLLCTNGGKYCQAIKIDICQLSVNEVTEKIQKYG